MRAEELLDAILELGPTVKAAAVYPGSGEPVFRLRTGADQRSAVGGEYWEEAVVNPTLLDLVRRCGAARHEGLEHLIIRYADCWLLLIPFDKGHASITFQPSADPIPVIASIRSLGERHGLGFSVASWDRG